MLAILGTRQRKIWAVALVLGLLMSGVTLLVKAPPCAFGQAACPVSDTALFSQDLGIQGGTTFTATLTAAPTANRTYTFPDVSLGVVGTDTTQTLTNKSIAATQITAGTFVAGTFSFSGSTLTTLGTVTSLGTVNGGTINAGLTWSAAQNLNSQALTNVNIDSGNISASTISGGLTWSAAQNLGSVALTNVNIDSGNISAATISGGLTWSASQDFDNRNLTNIDINSGDISGVTISSGLTWGFAQDFSNFEITNVKIGSGTEITGSFTWNAAQDFNNQALTNVNIDSGDVSAATVSGGLTWSAAQNFASQALTNVNIDSGTVNGITSLSIDTDSAAFTLGAGADSSLIYDGTNTAWDLQAVGTGALDLQGTGLMLILHDDSAAGSPEIQLRQAGSPRARIAYIDTDDVFLLDSDDRIRFGVSNTSQWEMRSGFLRDMTGNYVELLERAAPGAGPANSVRIYAVVDGGSLTDLAAVFQDGTVDIFAQELTEETAPILTHGDRTAITMEMRKPHPGLIQWGYVYPDGQFFVYREIEYHDPIKISWNKGAVGPLPSDWLVEGHIDRTLRNCSERGGTWNPSTVSCEFALEVAR